jgi:cullin-4
MHKLGQKLYDRVRDACAENAARLVRLLAVAEKDPASFLAKVEKLWSTYCSQLSLMRAVFLYLDRTFVPSASGLKPLWELGLHLLSDELRASASSRDDVLGRIVASFLSQVDAERRGETVDQPVLASVSRMLAALKLYASELESLLLLATGAFFEIESAANMGSMDAAEYLLYAETRLKAEKERAAALLEPSTQRPLLLSVESKLLVAHLGDLLDRGFNSLMAQLRTPDLRRLYAMCARVGKTDDVRRVFQLYCREHGQSIVGTEDDEAKDKTMIQALLSFREAMLRLINDAFGASDLFLAALRSAFDIVCNVRDNRTAELVAKYLDQVLRTGAAPAAASSSATAASAASGGSGSATGGASSEETLEAVLDNVMALFRCVHVKDVFEAFYKKDLAKRLLLNRSASLDAEKGMVARLKTECGSQFTSKLEGMFKDVELSEELRSQFLSSPAASSKPSGMDMVVHVLTSSHWPSYPPMAVTLPPEIAAGAAAFEKFYDVKYNKNRRLLWQHSLGHCTLKAAFPSAGAKQLDVSTFQAMVLLRFNETDSISFTDLKSMTGIEDSELRRTLQSLACGQHRVLRKEPKGKEVEDGDSFHYNSTFTAPMVRIKINQIQIKETKAEQDATNEQVLQHRQYQVRRCCL